LGETKQKKPGSNAAFDTAVADSFAPHQDKPLLLYTTFVVSFMIQKDVLIMATKIMPISDFRRLASQVIRAIQEDGDVVYITQHGRPAAVLVDYDQYEALLAQLEDLSDLASLEAAEGEPERGYETFLAEMGLESSLNPDP
jgi:prevent-host-death family protein